MKDLWKKQIEELQYYKGIILIFYFFTVVMIIGTGIWNHSKITEILKLVVISIILVSMMLFYTKFIQSKLLEHKLNCYIIIGSYLFSFLCSMISFKIEVYNLWMLSSILISLIIDTHLGISFHLLFSFFIGMIRGYSLEEVLVYFILGTLGCLFVKFTTDMDKFGYVFIIFISTNITLIFLIHNFSFQFSMYKDILFSTISSIVVVVSAYFIYALYNKGINPEITENLPAKWDTGKNVTVEKVEINGMKEIDVRINGFHKQDTDTVDETMIIENLMSEDNPLNHRFYAFSPELYLKSEQMGEVCFEASKKINANARLAGAGAFYHKIGKIVGNNYIEEGIKLLEENNAPQKLIDIVAQYHMKYGIPKSKEAAIVMLADSIISSIDVLKKSSRTFTISKLVDNVMSLRLSKGSLDESELTLVEIKQLQEFFTDHLSTIMNEYKREE